MTDVTLNRDFKAVPEGQVHPRIFKAGSVVSGRVARSALSAGAATAASQPAPPTAKSAAPEMDLNAANPPENRARRPARTS